LTVEWSEAFALAVPPRSATPSRRLAEETSG
jgi:hypothetical protein